MNRDTSMELEIIADIARLRAIRPQWEALLARSPCNDFFLTPSWVHAWWEVYGVGRELLTVALWENGELRALFPLYSTRRGIFRVIVFLGQPRQADRTDFILEKGCEDESLRLFTQWLFARNDWDYLSLREFGAFTDQPERLDRLAREAGRRTVLTGDTACAYIQAVDFPDLDCYLEQTRGKKRSKDIRRRRRRMAEREDVRWEILNRVDETTIDEMAELDNLRSQRGRQGKCFFQNPTNKKFLRTLFYELAERDRIRLVTLRIAGRLMAYDLLYSYNGDLLAYQGAFDDSMRSESIGTLTFIETLEYAIKNRYCEYDFLSGEESYKSDWTDRHRTNRRLIVYSGTGRSCIVHIYHRYIKPLRRRLACHAWLRALLPDRIRRNMDL